MTKADSSRIQSTQTKNYRHIGPGSFTVRVQSTVDTRTNTQANQGNKGQTNTGLKN